MKRIGFTIILNGIHHLKNNNYAEYLINECFDKWYIVEGATKSFGSTNWVQGGQNITNFCDSQGHSTDGTLEYIRSLEERYPDKVKVLTNDGLWNSKDDMVNSAISGMIADGLTECYLWEIDCDEVWKKHQMEISEHEMTMYNCRIASFRATNMVGKDLVAVGPNWGGNLFYRMWHWKGEYFVKHEPPVLAITEATDEIICSEKFLHNSYIFEKDVNFKASWYYNDMRILEDWKSMQELDDSEFPVPLTRMFPNMVNNWQSDKCLIFRIK